MKISNKEFEEFIFRSDVLTQDVNGMSLGEIYMNVLEELHPGIYAKIHDTNLNVYIYRENILLLFKYLMS